MQSASEIKNKKSGRVVNGMKNNMGVSAASGKPGVATQNPAVANASAGASSAAKAAASAITNSGVNPVENSTVAASASSLAGTVSSSVAITSANSASIAISPVDAKLWTPLVDSDSTALQPITGFSAALKRLEDFVLGSIALLILFPLMALISIIVKLDSTGPALFCQARSGRNGEIIKVYKFRTMFQNGSQEFKQARKDDPRITRVGAFLRKTSLDELPQLFNVIQGTMSLVGPRPHPLKLDEDFKYVIPALQSRYCVKPGITGWAQINGFRGETRRVSDMVSRIEHDRYYVMNWSIFLDLRILVLTVLKGWIHKNAY